MKSLNIIIVFALIFFTSYSCDDSPAQDYLYTVTWDFNNNDPVHLDSTGQLWTKDYLILIADNLNDTLSSPLVDIQPFNPSLLQYSIGRFNHDSLYAINPDTAIVKFMSQQNGKWLTICYCFWGWVL